MNLDQKIIDAEINKIAGRTNGPLTPEAVFAAAEPEDHPLHSAFEWDRERAYAAHNHQIARSLIRSVKLTVTIDKINFGIPAYIRDPSMGGEDQGYCETVKLRNEPENALLAVMRECGTAESYLHRARTLSIVLGHAQEFDNVIAGLVDIRNRIRAKSESLTK